MVFNRLKAQNPEKVRKTQVQSTPLSVKVEEVSRTKHAPFWLKLSVNIKLAMSEVDPFITIQVITAVALVIISVILIILPVFKLVQDFSNKWAIVGAVTSFLLGMFIMDVQNKRVREGVCEVAIGGKTYMFDNHKIDIYDGGEIIYRVNQYGQPIICRDENNLRRWGKQENLFIPKDVITQFDSIIGRRAKSYPDCHTKEVHMEDIDAGIMYIPRKISETRLVKQVEALEEQLKVFYDLNEQFKQVSKKIAASHADFEGIILNDLIKKQTSLQEAFWGTGAKFRQLVNDSLYTQKYNNYPNYYNRYQGSNVPNWRNVSSGQPQSQQSSEDESEGQVVEDGE